MSPRCSWAACKRGAVAFEDGWPMCRPHLLEHRRQVEEDTRRHELAVYGRRISGRRIERPCGTHAAYERHRRLSETPCDDCITAEKTYQQQRYARQREAS